MFAPELELLERAHGDEVARRMLEKREAISAEDVEKARQAAALAAAQVEIQREQIPLEPHRAAPMEKVVEYADERVEHMKRWRQISKYGPGILIGSLVVAAAAIVYVLAVLVPRGHVNGETAALIIFTLAVFVTAPATLLLRERPLRGIDQFMPGGKADGSSDDPKAPAEGAGSGSDAKGKGSKT